MLTFSKRLQGKLPKQERIMVESLQGTASQSFAPHIYDLQKEQN